MIPFNCFPFENVIPMGEVPRRNHMFFISGVRKKTSPDIIFGGHKATKQGATFLDKHVGKLWERFISEH